MYGNFKTIEKARAESENLANKGFKDAYVISYLNGEHIKLDRAIALEKNNPNYTEMNKTTTSTNIIFMVQVGAYRENLDANEESNLYKSYSPNKIDKKFYQNMNLYTIGHFTTYKEAETLKKKLMNEGHQDVFIVSFDGNEKISVSEAINRMKK